MLLNNLKPEIEAVYYDHAFLVMIEDHLTYLRTSVNSGIRQITEHQNYKYEGDFYGLLDDIGIEKKFHFIVARVNGLDSSADYKGDMAYILIPDLDEVELLKGHFQTKNF